MQDRLLIKDLEIKMIKPKKYTKSKQNLPEAAVDTKVQEHSDLIDLDDWVVLEDPQFE